MMRFFLDRPGFIVAQSDLPGNHATFFAPNGTRLRFRPDISNWSDAERVYRWGFEHITTPPDGAVYIFATADRAVAVRVFGGSEMRAEHFDGTIIRSDAGEPLRVLHPPPRVQPVRPTRIETDAGVCTMPPHALRAVAGVPRDQPRPPAQASRGVQQQARRPRTLREAPSPAPIAPRATVRPKVSIVTCSHDRPDLLRAAVESLRRQTNTDWEHLIYDDASTDKRVAEVLEWAAEDPRVRIWRGRSNLDRPAALWNFMFDRALGRYFAVLDDDNEKLDDFVGAMGAQLDADQHLDLVTCGWLIRDDRDFNPDQPYHLNLSTCRSELDRISTCDGGSSLFRRELFEEVGYFDEGLCTNEDWDWVRRAHHVLLSKEANPDGETTPKVKNLHEIYATYRSHHTNRMLRSEALGSPADAEFVRRRSLSTNLSVTLTRPPRDRLTRSQEDVCQGVERALAAIPWVKQGAGGVAFVVSPFQLRDDEIRRAVAGSQVALSLHMEDPYALAANSDRIRVMRQTAAEVWVCTNDGSTVEHYRALVGNSVVVCPSLSADDLLPAIPKVDRDVDVLLCGYAYPSRKKFVDELLPHLNGLRVLLVGGGDGNDAGNGWTNYPCESMPAQDAESTRRLHARARTVICAHRVQGDCGDDGRPDTVCRGYMEGFLGPRVFLDRTRSRHPHDDGDVIFYGDAVDLAARLRGYLDDGASGTLDDGASGTPAEAVTYQFKCTTLYTYRARLARVLNCVRTRRYLAEVP